MELRDPHLLMLLALELAGHCSNTIRGTVDSAQLMFPGQRLGGTHEEGSKGLWHREPETAGRQHVPPGHC